MRDVRITLGTTALASAAALWGLGRLLRRGRRIELRRRTVLVTGGGRGLGFALAGELVRKGAVVAICGRDAGELRAAEEALDALPGANIIAHPCDTSDPAQVRELVDHLLATWGRIDILVNNAGQCFIGPVADLGAETLEAALRHIFWAQLHPTLAVLPHMRARRFGRIVNVSSIGGLIGLPHQAAYAAGKFALTGFSQSLRAELVRDGIYVTTIAPPPLRNGAPLYVHYAGRAQREFHVFTRALTSPLTSMSNTRAARRIVRALRYGDGLCTLSLRNWAYTQLNGLAPNFTTAVLALMNRLLPPPRDREADGPDAALVDGMDVVRQGLPPETQRLALRTTLHAQTFRPLGPPLPLT